MNAALVNWTEAVIKKLDFNLKMWYDIATIPADIHSVTARLRVCRPTVKGLNV